MTVLVPDNFPFRNGDYVKIQGSIYKVVYLPDGVDDGFRRVCYRLVKYLRPYRGFPGYGEEYTVEKLNGIERATLRVKNI